MIFLHVELSSIGVFTWCSHHPDVGTKKRGWYEYIPTFLEWIDPIQSTRGPVFTKQSLGYLGCISIQWMEIVAYCKVLACLGSLLPHFLTSWLPYFLPSLLYFTLFYSLYLLYLTYLTYLSSSTSLTFLASWTYFLTFLLSYSLSFLLSYSLSFFLSYFLTYLLSYLVT